MLSYPIVSNDDNCYQVSDYPEIYTEYLTFGNANTGKWNQWGLKFNNIQVAKNAIVTLAKLKFIYYDHNEGVDQQYNHEIHGVNAATVNPWSNENLPNSQPITTEKVDVNVIFDGNGDSTINGELKDSEDPFEFDVTAIVQEIINRADWALGNNIGFTNTRKSPGGDNYNSFIFYWYTENPTKVCVLEITLALPVVSEALPPDPKMPNGYTCFIKQFVKNSLAGNVPPITPDGANRAW
jgi:hypothetical protein